MNWTCAFMTIYSYNRVVKLFSISMTLGEALCTAMADSLSSNQPLGVFTLSRTAGFCRLLWMHFLRRVHLGMIRSRKLSSLFLPFLTCTELLSRKFLSHRSVSASCSVRRSQASQHSTTIEV